MLNKLIERLFYSKLFRNIRFEHYHNAYEQGRFDEDMDRTYGLDRYGKQSKNTIKSEYTLQTEVEFKGKLLKKPRIEDN